VLPGRGVVATQKRNCILVSDCFTRLMFEANRNIRHRPDDILEIPILRSRTLLKLLALVVLAYFAVLPGWAEPEVRSDTSQEILNRYQGAMSNQREAFRDVAMDVEFDARIPKLQKQGKLSAIRRISSLGRVTYKLLGFQGDDTVKKEVIARYMTAEVESAQERKDEIALTPQNYEFKYKGLNDRSGRQVHIFELKPRSKRVGLFKGELWLDPATYLPIRESGRLVKNPSVFIKKVEFTRDYEIVDGVAYLRRMESRTDTRVVGRAELDVRFANFHKQEPAAEELVEEARGR
jgi:hypothetical protein